MLTIQRATAENYTVTATVPGDTLTAPAVITSPSSGAVVTTSTITVAGICQNVNSGTLVTLTRDGTALGAAVCGPASTFSIPITLVPGENAIAPYVQTGLGDDGPNGQAIQVTYKEPLAVAEPKPELQNLPPIASSTDSAATPTPGPRIEPASDMVLRQQVGRTVTLRFALVDGAAPYTLRTDWGDGQIETKHIDQADTVIVVTHVYAIAGMYTVSLEAVDTKGRKAVLGFVVYSHAAASLSTPFGYKTLPPLGGGFVSTGDWLTITRTVWVGYALVSVGLIIMWYISPNHRLIPLLHTPLSKNQGKKQTSKKGLQKKRHA